MIRKFPKLEKVCFDSPSNSCLQYSKQTIVDFSSFISNVPKFILNGFLVTTDDVPIVELVDNFMQSTATTNNLTALINVKLFYCECDEMDFMSDPLLTDFLHLNNFIKIATNESDSEIYHEWAFPSKDRSYNLDIQLNRLPSDIVTSRASFNEEFFKTSGSRITQLKYTPSMKIMPHIACLCDAQNQIAVTKKDGLEPILKYCTSLTNLDLSLMRLSKDPQRAPIINNSIKSLRFEHSTICEESLIALSIRFPALKILVVENCVVTRNHEYPILFNMNNTSFESITFQLKGSFSYVVRKSGSNLIMKVTLTENKYKKIQYLRFDKSSVEEITSATYSDLLSDSDCLSLEMFCKEISHLSVKLDKLPKVDYYFDM